MTPASPHQHGCNTAYFYYCTNASDVLSVAAESGKAAAVRFWLETMETNLDIPSRNQGSMRVDLTPLGGPFDATIRQAIAFRARVVERFVNQSNLFPPSIVPPRTPVLYPFSGMDVLTAMHFFPHASSYTLLANLELGRRAVDPLDCFADYECVRVASRSAYKVCDCNSTCVWRDHGNCARLCQRLYFVPTIRGFDASRYPRWISHSRSHTSHLAPHPLNPHLDLCACPSCATGNPELGGTPSGVARDSTNDAALSCKLHWGMPAHLTALPSPGRPYRR